MWQLKTFHQLTNLELFTLWQARMKVFIVEQNCPYQDIDSTDLTCLHLFKMQQDELISYARIIPPASEMLVKFGRVLVPQHWRNTGQGRRLVNKVLEIIQQRYSPHPIHIQAQVYLLNFYAGFGFKPVGAEYLEDHIPHIDMQLQPNSRKNI